MACDLYKQHLIVSTATFDSKTRRWKAVAFVSWGDAANRKFHSIADLHYQFDNPDAAEVFGINALKSWVDSP